MFLGRIVKRGEPIWLDEDRMAAVAWADWVADLHVCGQPLSETTAMKLDDRGRKVPVHTYEAISAYCAACLEVDRERAESEDDQMRGAVVYAAHRVD